MYKNYLNLAIQPILKMLGIGLTRYSSLQNLILNRATSRDIDILLDLPKKSAMNRLNYLRRSKSELRQDLFVLSMLNFKRNGFFVEFGATNGVHHSNSYLMEKFFGWSGILAEPAKCWHKDLKINRSANIETSCVWKNSNSILKFNEVKNASFSTIATFSSSNFSLHRTKGRKNI